MTVFPPSSPALSHQCGGSLSATILNPLLQYKSEPHGVEESSLPSVDNATESKTAKKDIEETPILFTSQKWECAVER